MLKKQTAKLHFKKDELNDKNVNKAYKRANRAVKKADKANINMLYQKQKSVESDTVSNPISKWRQKQQIKKEYMAAKSGKSVSTNKYGN